MSSTTLPDGRLMLECEVTEDRLRVGDEIVVDLDGRKTACRIEAFEAGYCQGAFGELVCGEQALVRVSIL